MLSRRSNLNEMQWLRLVVLSCFVAYLFRSCTSYDLFSKTQAELSGTIHVKQSAKTTIGDSSRTVRMLVLTRTWSIQSLTTVDIIRLAGMSFVDYFEFRVLENDAEKLAEAIKTVIQVKPFKVLIHDVQPYMVENTPIETMLDNVLLLANEFNDMGLNVVLFDYTSYILQIRRELRKPNWGLVITPLAKVVQQFLQSIIAALDNPNTANSLHIIGLGIGAHIAGNAGRIFQATSQTTIYRITALDPPGKGVIADTKLDSFSFVCVPAEDPVFIKSTDASIVDAIFCRDPCIGRIFKMATMNFFVDRRSSFAWPENPPSFCSDMCQLKVCVHIYIRSIHFPMKARNCGDGIGKEKCLTLENRCAADFVKEYVPVYGEHLSLNWSFWHYYYI